MPNLILKGHADLVRMQAAAIQGRARKLIDFSVGSTLRAVVESNSGVALWLQGMALRILTATRAATSSGEDLDTWVGDFGVIRLGARSSAGLVTFSRYTGGVQAVVPIGATVQSADGSVDFAVVLDATNPSYNAGLGGYVMPANVLSVAVPVAAIRGGFEGNVDAGSVTVMTSQITYVDEVVNGAPISGGADFETDAELRARFVRFINSLSRGTNAAIIYAITSLQAGAQATIIENIAPDNTPTPGMLTITVDDGSAAPPASFVTNAIAKANEYRAGGIRIGVFPPEIVYVDVALTITVAEGYDYQTVVGSVASSIAGYIEGMRLGQSLAINRLSQIALNVSAGVENVTSVSVNYANADVAATPRQRIRARVVAIS